MLMDPTTITTSNPVASDFERSQRRLPLSDSSIVRINFMCWVTSTGGQGVRFNVKYSPDPNEGDARVWTDLMDWPEFVYAQGSANVVNIVTPWTYLAPEALYDELFIKLFYEETSLCGFVVRFCDFHYR